MKKWKVGLRFNDKWSLSFAVCKSLFDSIYLDLANCSCWRQLAERRVRNDTFDMKNRY